MSISPTDANTSEPSSPPSRYPVQNPSSDHGCGRRAQEGRPDRRIRTPSSRGRPAGSPEVPAPEPDAVVESSGGSSVEITEEPLESSKNVTEHRNPDAKRASDGQDSGIFIESRPAVRGGISSQFRSDRFGPKINGKPSGTGRALHSDHMTAGSSGLHGNVVQSASRRNQLVNANHLLNFQYDPISRPPPRGLPPRRHRKIKPYNKDLFLQANYKFVVLDSRNYLIESMDPDKMLQWEDIVCVRYSSPSPVQCPICLESPLCPQITSCGHIYCFPCILRYLLMGEEDHKGDCWKKCPLCFLMMSSKDLLTVQIENVKQFHVGARADFTLLTRAKDSLVPSLKNQQEPDPESDTMYDSFSKFILTSDVELSVREAKSDLSSWLAKAESGLVDDLERLPYVCAALEQLEERMKNWTGHQTFNGTPPNSSFSSHKVANTPNKTDNSLNSATSANSVNSIALERGGRMSISGFKYDEISELPENIACERSLTPLSASPESFGSPEKVLVSHGEDRGSRSSCKDGSERESYAFYQATDGQHLILHPLNMKCLLHHYGSHDLLPPRISGEILEMEMVTQSEAIRRRYRYLSHFSLTTTFQLCEIDLSEILPPSSLAPFNDEIKKRKSQRARLAKKEQDEKARAEAAAALDVNAVPYDHFYPSHNNATFSLDDFEALGSAAVPSTSPPLNNGRKLFSDVTRLGFASASDSPSLKPEASANSSGNMEKTGEASSAQGSRPMTTLSFASIMSAPTNAGSPATQNASGLGKKGKKPTKVLLSTAGGRRY
ncbi:RING finger protein 10 [Iris pallida]|uniref:RING finger protein 10 n=1 Tax=Iris pallida TaxID=29817 RepID=A0AAX6H951_IRIPA|nr:RING finger protein 10 [Iris pallida]KAJ6846001.1 RING finger protein 10 [Iris pallida]